MQTTFTALEVKGLIPEILKHIEQVSDLVRCVGVSKIWGAACQTVQPLHISIGGDSKKPLKVAGLSGILQWLQKQQLLCNLQSVQGLTLMFTEGFVGECYIKSRLCMCFAQSCLAIAGCLPLTSCELTDQDVQLESIVSLLPLTLQNLKIKGNACEGSGAIDLSVCQQLRNLQTLHLDIGGCPRTRLGSCFVLVHKLASLQKLMLVPRACLLGESPTVLLPSLQFISASISVYQVQRVLAHPCLRHAHLICESYATRDDSDTEDAAAYVLHIGEDSQLESLSLALNGAHMKLQLNIAKPNIDFDCCGVIVRFRNTSAASFLPIARRK